MAEHNFTSVANAQWQYPFLDAEGQAAAHQYVLEHQTTGANYNNDTGAWTGAPTPAAVDYTGLIPATSQTTEAPVSYSAGNQVGGQQTSKTELPTVAPPLAGDVQTGGTITTVSTQPQVTATPPTLLEQIMAEIKAEQEARKNQAAIAAPDYQQADYSAILPAQHGAAVTADASKTSFTPTTHYFDRVNNEKQQIDAATNAANDFAYKSYLGQVQSQKDAQDAQQQQLADLISLLPQVQLTAAQQVEADINKEKNAEDKRQFEMNYGLDKRTTDYNTGKPYYAPNSGSSSGVLTANQSLDWLQSQEAARVKFAAEMASKDSKLDQPRWEGATDAKGYVTSGQNIPTWTYQDLYDAWYKDPRNPYSTAVNPNQPSQDNTQTSAGGNVDSWVNTAIQNKGVPAEWADGLKWIIQHESSGNPTAKNPNSTAYGLMQFLDSTWGNYGYQKTSDPVNQVVAGIDYIKSRYGTPANAVAFWQKNGWY